MHKRFLSQFSHAARASAFFCAFSVQYVLALMLAAPAMFACASSTAPAQLEQQVEALRRELAAMKAQSQRHVSPEAALAAAPGATLPAAPAATPPPSAPAPHVLLAPASAVASATAGSAVSSHPPGAPALPVVKLSPPGGARPVSQFTGAAPVARALTEEQPSWSARGPEVIVLPDHGLSDEIDAWGAGVSGDPESTGAELPPSHQSEGAVGISAWQSHVAGLPDAGEAIEWPAAPEPPSRQAARQRSQPLTAPPPQPDTSPDFAPASGSAAQSLYDQGMSALRSRSYPEAEHAFQRLLGEHRTHHLADNAQYWLAEIAYDERRYGDALDAFRAVVEQFPLGNKVPDAMVKMGLCFRALGSEPAARDLLEQVVRLYPRTDAAAVAASRLH